ncbi:MAG: IS4 family transposase [Phototrophicaceae bacterium]
MFNSQSYSKWQAMLKQLIPDKCESRLTNLVLLIVGIFEAKSVYLSLLAREIPIRAKKLSLAKRLERFLDNEAVEVDAWYHPWASWLLQSASVGGRVHLVIDTTKVSAYCRQVMVSVAYQRRTLPIMWDWVEYPRGHCTTALQISLLRRLYPLLPLGVQVSLVGDSEFGKSDLIDVLQVWNWDYALRQKGNTLFRQTHDGLWKRLDSVDVRREQALWIGHVSLAKSNPCQTHLIAYWKQGEKDPWYLATNQLSALPTLRLYKRRMWIEEMFGDMKGHGFDLELSRLRTPKRLSRLTLAVSILYVWLVTTGEYVLLMGFNTEVDRNDRQDLSIFRLGWDWLARRFTFDDPIPILFRPYFCLVSGC